MKTRILHTKIWKDSFFVELSPTEKLLFIYFITNEKVNIIHCYECTDREIIFDTGINRGILEKIKVKFQLANKIFFFKDYVFLKNADKYEDYSGEKNEIAKEQLIKLFNDDVKEWFFKVKNNIVDTPIHTPMDRDYKSKVINNKSKVEGGVGGDFLTKDELDDLQNKFPTKSVASEYAQAIDWLAASGKHYKNYLAFFRNWLRRSKDTRDPPKEYKPKDIPEITDEQRQKNLEYLKQCREKILKVI